MHAAVRVVIGGNAGTVITNGQVRGSAENLWSLPETVTIPVSGQITVTATADETGAIEASAGAVSRIATPTDGWISVSNPNVAAVGKEAQTDAELRVLQTNSTAQPSQSVLQGIQGELMTLDGVTRLRMYENDTSDTDKNGIPSHSISAVVEGGDSNEIAEVIRRRKTAGTGTYRSTAITLTDSTMMPITIRFFRPTVVQIKVEVTIKPLLGYASTYGEELKKQVCDYINSLGIGATLYLSKLYVPATLENDPTDSNYDILSIELAKNDGVMQTQHDANALNDVIACDIEDLDVVTADEG